MSNSINRIVSTTEEQIFGSVENAFKTEINYITETVKPYYPILSTINPNLCCSKEEKKILLDLAIKIKENENLIFGTEVTFKDICIGLIYTYYGLNLNEHIFYFNISVLPRNRENKIVVDKKQWTVTKEFNLWINTYSDNISTVYVLFLKLGMPSSQQKGLGEIITRDGENLTQKLRQFVISPQPITLSSSSSTSIKPVKSSTRPISKRGGKKNKSKRKSRRTKRRRA